MQVAPSGYWRHAAQRRNPALRSARAQRDDLLMPEIQRVWQANMQVYGADPVGRPLHREGLRVARWTVERLMKRLGLEGVRRGKVVRTTVPDPAVPCPLDRVNRPFKADRPNQLWAAQETFKTTALEPRLAEAQTGQRAVFFVDDAAHFVLAPFLGMLWSFTRLFIRAPAGRQRFNVLAALNAITHE